MAHLYCPNCHHTGRPKKKLNSGSSTITGLLLLASFFIWPLFLLSLPALLLCAFEKRETSCRKCGWQHLAPKAPPETAQSA
jgi:ribosomal protein L40E